MPLQCHGRSVDPHYLVRSLRCGIPCQICRNEPSERPPSDVDQRNALIRCGSWMHLFGIFSPFALVRSIPTISTIDCAPHEYAPTYTVHTVSSLRVVNFCALVGKHTRVHRGSFHTTTAAASPSLLFRPFHGRNDDGMKLI